MPDTAEPSRAVVANPASFYDTPHDQQDQWLDAIVDQMRNSLPASTGEAARRP